MADYYKTLNIDYKEELTQPLVQSKYQDAMNAANLLKDANTKRGRVLEINQAREKMLEFCGNPEAKNKYLESLKVTEVNKDDKEAQKNAAESVQKRMMNASVDNYKTMLEEWRKRHPDVATQNPGGDMVTFLFLELFYYNRGSMFDPMPGPYKGFDSKNLEKMYIPERSGKTVSELEAEFVQNGELNPLKDKDGKVIGGEFINKEAQEKFKAEMKKLQATSDEVAEATKQNADTPAPGAPRMKVS